MQSTATVSYMDIVTTTTMAATGGTSTYANSCGKTDLISGATTAANNKGPTACATVGSFTTSKNYEVIGLSTDATSGGWTSV